MCAPCNKGLYKKSKVQKEKPSEAVKPERVKKKHYREYKKTYCEYCGFVAVDKRQLDVDHIDGNHSNNNENNLQTLCANCHRLKTKLNRDGPYRSK